MKYVIIKLCCHDCLSLQDIFFTDDDYIDFITSLNDYKDSFYMIFKDSVFLAQFDGYDL